MEPWQGWFIFAAIFGAFTAWLADEKGRSPLSWFILGFLFQLVALLALGFAPALSEEELASEAEDFRHRMEQPQSSGLSCRSHLCAVKGYLVGP